MKKNLFVVAVLVFGIFLSENLFAQSENSLHSLKVMGSGYGSRGSRYERPSHSNAYDVQTSSFSANRTVDTWLGFYIDKAYRLRRDTMGTLNCDYILECDVDDAFTLSWKHLEEHDIYKKNPETKKLEKVGTKMVEESESESYVKLSAVLTNAKTGEKFSNSFDGDGSQDMFAAMSASKKVANWVNSLFPVTAKITTIDKASKKSIKRLHLDVGTDLRITDKSHFWVFLTDDTKKSIAHLNVKTVDGANSCLCTIMSGGKALKEKLDTGIPIVILSRSEK